MHLKRAIAAALFSAAIFIPALSRAQTQPIPPCGQTATSLLPNGGGVATHLDCLNEPPVTPTTALRPVPATGPAVQTARLSLTG